MNTQIKIALTNPYILINEWICKFQVRHFFMLLIILALFWLMVFWSIVQTFLTTFTLTPALLTIIKTALWFLNVSKNYLEVPGVKFV